MIVKISGSGKSFSGLSTYLTHDPKEQTAERVDFTHSHNLANDHISSAVDEMLWTARNAELLKQENGTRAGGQSTKNTVKHVSLNWAIEDNPSQQHMIATAEHFLKYMGWSEHQAIFVAHNDKAYKHLHIMINQIHPETGLKLNDGFEQRRVQKWAAAYELEQGRVYCEQRMLNAEDREKAMPRNMWMAFTENERDFEKFEKNLSENAEIPEYHPNNRKAKEWKILKEIQKDERLEFFADGKTQFSELRSTIYREVREEFRERWSNYYKGDKNTVGEDRRFLPPVKAQIIADQKAVLEPRRDKACAELKEDRQVEYRDILDRQRETRAEFGWRLDVGLDNAQFFHDIQERQRSKRETRSAFSAAVRETTETDRETTAYRDNGFVKESSALTAVAVEAASVPSRQVGSTAMGFLDSLFTGLTNLGSAPKTYEPLQGERDEFEVAAEEATKQVQHQEREEHDAKWRQHSKELYGE